MKLSFRPHHFLCTLGFQGKGFSPAFVENYSRIIKALKADDSLCLEVVTTGDSICQACPHREGTGCSQDEKIRKLDRNHAQILDLKAGDRLTWKEGQALLKEKMSLEAFHQACAGCSWKSLGMCEEALVRLHKSS